MGDFDLYGCPDCTTVFFHGDGWDESTSPCPVCGFDPTEDEQTWVNVYP